MKQRLKAIYQDLSEGKLTQQEALERIKALKLQEQDKREGVLLSAPVWEQSSMAALSDSSKPEYIEQHIVVYGLAGANAQQVEKLVPGSRCLSLPAAPQKNVAERYCEFSLACFEKLQSIIKSKPQGKVLIQVCIAGSEEEEIFAGISGLLKTASLENPQLVGQVILTASQATAEELAAQLRNEQARPEDKIVKYKQGVRNVLRWKEVEEVLNTDAPAITFKDHGVYLITGGLGGLGVLFAKEIIRQTSSTTIILAGRSALSADRKKALEALQAERKSVEYRQADITDPVQAKQLLASIQKEHKQLNGIIHSAGVIVDNFILKKTSQEFKQVLMPKVTGAYNLDQASQEADLDFFVLFSSIASAIGNVGQADYAAANGFLDQFASYRNRLAAAKNRKGKTLSINWPLWQDGGMKLDQASQDMIQQTLGLQSIPNTIGMLTFHRCLGLQYSQAMVLKGDLSKVRGSLFNDFSIQSAPSPVVVKEEQPVAAAIDPNSLLEKTQEFLKKELAGLLKMPSHKIDAQAPLERYGIDSILAVSLTGQLDKTFGPLSKTLFFEYQTIHELAQYFIKAHTARLYSIFDMENVSQKTTVSTIEEQKPQIQAAPVKALSGKRFSAQSKVAASPSSQNTVSTEPIAIIGLSGRFPESVNITEYWNNLREGKDCIVEVPKERWDWRDYYSEDRNKNGHHYSKWGGFIAGVDEFDPRFFNIAPREAENIDPQERLFLQHCWMAMEDAGYTRASLQIPNGQDLPGQVGVYVGVMYGEYQLFGAEISMNGKRMGIPGSYASISNRVSYVLNLHGPSMTVDTMCSSSLTAIHLACQDLKLGRTSLAIAGGVNVTIHPNKYLVLSGGQFISSDGHCQSFGEGGDGYIPGEGVGAVILKRLSEAVKDGDHIYGVIKGSILNHGGKTNGYSVPNPQAQASVISRALAESNVNPRHISYIEAHGTGTKLGDPIEIAALSKAFQQYTQDTGFCLIGSAKSNIGHCESAAGIAGVAKVLLQIQHQQIVPSLHSKKLNPHIDFEKTPFIVNQTLRPWEQPEVDGHKVPRIAGISSFGAGGSNAHIIIQEYVPASGASRPVSVSGQGTKVIIPLSARTEDQLKQKAQDLLSFIQTSQPDLVAMAYTLQVGREAMEERVGFMVSSVEQLAERLKAYINGEQNIEDAYQGQVKRNKETLSLFSTDADLQQTVEKWIAEKKLLKLLDLWVKGLELDWNKLYGSSKPGRISLPSYPFARERYWVDTTVEGHAVSNASKTKALHPLLHENTSDLNEQSYSSSFSGKEFFLSDYQTSDGTGRKVLSAAAYLEMARVAVEKALPGKQESSILELHNTAWGEPFVVAENKQISIALFSKESNRVDFEVYSRDEDEETVHCQGQAIFVPKTAQARLDIEQLKQKGQGAEQLLTGIQLPAGLANNAGDYVLHPAVVDNALQLANGLTGNGQLSAPFAIESLSIISGTAKELWAWVRYTQGGKTEGAITKLNIDLCDLHGNVCVRMRGVAYQKESQEVTAPVAVQPVSKATPVETKQVPVVQHTVAQHTTAPRKISIPALSVNTSLPSFDEQPLEKPSGISVVALDDIASEKIEQTPIAKATVTLSEAAISLSEQTVQTDASSSVGLFDLGNGIFSVQIAAASNNALSQELTAQLLQAFKAAQKEASLRVLILSGTAQTFLRGGRKEYNQAVEQKLYHAITTFPYPVIAAMQGDATGAGFLAGALCDFMVCSTGGNYYYTNTNEGLYPSSKEYKFFEERFGEARATDFLYLSSASTGAQLREKGWTCPILPAEQVEAYAKKLAASLAGKSDASLRLLKKHLSRHILRVADELAVVEPLTNEGDSAKANDNIKAPAKYIGLETHEGNVLVIRMCVGGNEYGLKALVADLKNVFTQVNKASQYKTIVLASEHPDFLPGAEKQGAINDVLDFQSLVLDCRIPVIAVLDTNTKGAAWLVSLCCDACIYNAKANYSAGNIWQSKELARQAVLLFAERLGSYAGKEVLLTGKEYSGSELQRLAGAIHIAEKGQTHSAALQLAAYLGKWPLTALVARKKEEASGIRERIKSLPVWSEAKEETPGKLSATPVSIPVASKVISATAHPEGILVVKMEDREAKNMFSEAFIEGMNEVFAHVEKTPSYKVVVLTGYDNYFASGGTKDTLLAIQEGKTKFTDNRIYQIAMTCKIPVIAAMQGHGIGAGWALGMFADFVLFSEESRYFSPYMNYGFTPGAGATFIFPERIGHDLAKETLMTADEYAGSELKQRGVVMPVLPREQVSKAAMELARQIANRSRGSLIAFKNQVTHDLYKPLEETYQQELAMHEQTFVGQQDTLKQINTNFFQANSDSNVETEVITEKTIPASAQQTVRPVAAASASAQDKDVQSSVTATLRKLLAQELHLHEHEIEDNIQFVDLGLDSITGVTWIRKINEKYNTSIEATKIYSYPTLAQLSSYVREEAENAGAFPAKSELNLPAGTSFEAETSYIELQVHLAQAEVSQSVDNLPGVVATLRTLLAQELHLHESEIDENTQFIDLGLDSITGVTWIRKINEKYNTSIEATKIYSYPTLTQLSSFVKEEAEKLGTLSVQPESAALPAKSELTVVAKPQQKIVSRSAAKKLLSWRNRTASRQSGAANAGHLSQPIAVIGMSGQFPQARNVEEFWQNLAGGKNCISEIPKERWDVDAYFQEGSAVPGKTNAKWMGLLDEYDLFDPLFFNISPTEAESMDPQQRLFLQESWRAIENAGYNPKNLYGSKCGVFVGCANGDYLQLSEKHRLSAQGFTGGATSILAARISYFLNLQGPCISIDTACSSSLVAIASACDSLNSGSSDLALAGGVCVMATPAMHIMCSQTGMLSTDGRCFTFDQRANGFVPGESVGVVMLKRLSDAERDQDKILGVIQGWGVNQDGKTNGITAPNAESQTRLEQEVYDKFRIDPAHIQLIEAHGTGTKLGDPIEVDALKQAFKKYTQKKEYCALGSVKSNIGHCLTAAGVASFIKVIQALNHKQLPPTVNYSTLNEHIGLENSPFFVNNKLQDWKVAGSERRHAAISAFGFSGTNAHIVLSEYVAPAEAESPVSVITENGKIIIPLSARTTEQLKQKAVDLLDFIRRKKQSVDLIDMAYTLQVGREEMGERLGLMVSSIEQLAEKLQAYIEGKENIEDIYQGQVKRNKEGISIISRDEDLKKTIVEQWIAQKKLSKLLDLWVKGLELNWHKLYGDAKPRRIDLPVYPFARERYWIEDGETILASKTGTAFGALHPLVHRNTSGFSRQSYTSTFSGKEEFLNDHQINGQKVLPEVACLEMARAAVVLSASEEQDVSGLEIKDIIWEQPVIVTEEKEVSIALYLNEEDEVDYEICTKGAEEETVHSSGKVVFAGKPAPSKLTKLNIGQLKGQMGNGTSEAAAVYNAFAKMDINYGSSLRGISTLYYGSQQLLAKIKVPASGAGQQLENYLQPGLMGSVLQACMALITNSGGQSNQPLRPVSLDKLTVAAPCAEEMYAWVRNSQGDKNFTLDVDLCDPQGNVCVTMKGLTLEYFSGYVAATPAVASVTEAAESAWDKMSYLYQWEEQASQPQNIPAAHKAALVVCSGASSLLESAILDHYRQNSKTDTLLIRLADSTRQLSEKEWTCGVQDPSGFKTCLQKAGKFDALYFLSMDGQQEGAASLKELMAGEERNEIQFLRLVQSLKQNNKIGEKVDTYILTLDNYSVNNQANNYQGGGITGLAYSLAQGSYQFKVRNLDLSSVDMKTSQSAGDLLAAIISEPPANRGEVFRLQSGKRYRQTFYKLNWDTAASPAAKAIKTNGTYVIAGGSGTVGQILTRNLFEKYQANVVWIGRSAESAERIQEALQEFEQFNGKLSYVQADVTNLDSIRKAVQTIKQKYPKIDGAVFSGMVTDHENSIDQVTEEEFRSSVSVKTMGSLNFYTALSEEPLDFMCYFSSGQAYSFTGAAKCAAYASGITFTDSLVKSIRNVAAFPVGIINWGFWKRSVLKMEGISADNLGALEDQEGFACFERFVGELQQGRLQQVLCMKVTSQVESLMNCSKDKIIAVAKGQTAYLPVSIVKDKAVASGTKQNKVQVQKAAVVRTSVNIEEHIQSTILDSLSGVLKIASDKIDPEITFSDYGIDSILGVKFVEQINSILSISLNTAVLFEFASIDRLSKHIITVYREQIERELDGQSGATEIAVEEAQVVTMEDSASERSSVQHRKRPLARPVSSGKHAPKLSEIAVVGISGKFPKAENVDEFWKNLVQGIDGVDELPSNYFDPRYYSKEKQKGKTRCKWGGVLAERDCFDPLFFKLSPKEAEAMNPHQRLVMQESWKALEDAGYNPKNLSGSQTGIFIGSEPTIYTCKSFTGYSDAIIASRLSYVLNLYGPAFVVNTGCSSSAVALHLACESLRNGESDMAIAGGVHACMEQNLQIRLDEIEMLSPSGRCFTFDSSGDGTIISEGVGIVILKRLEDAIKSGDHIYGVISGSGVNQDGTSNGITAPNGVAQEQLITSIYEKFNIDPEKITYVEAHGTGTKLGDPVEANALVRVFRKFTGKKEYCVVGSAKSHIGHTSAAAGVIGLIKVLLSLQHNTIPKLLNFKTLNPLIEFNGSPFYIPMQEVEWKPENGNPRMAAINSFGHSGTNAHLVIKEYLPAERNRAAKVQVRTKGDIIVPLSARTTEQLMQRAEDLLHFIRTAEAQPVDLLSMAYTLQTGREAMEERLGFVVSSVEQLADKLQAYINGEQEVEKMYQGTVTRNNKAAGSIHKEGDINESIEQWIAQDKLSKLVELWVKGLEFDWNKLYGDIKPQRISLPVYPFAKEHYWAENIALNQFTDTTVMTNTNLESIEDIINMIDNDSIDTEQAVKLLNNLA